MSRIKFTRVLVVAIALLACVSALATDFTIEPYAGYEFGYDVSGNTAYSESGPDFGMRVGLDIESFLIGGDYMMGNLSIASPSSVSSIKTSDIGAYLGYNSSVVRFWGEYWFSSSGSPSNGSSYSGSGGYALGLSVKVYELLSLFVEHSIRTYTSQGGQELHPNREIDGTIVGLSFPYNF